MPQSQPAGDDFSRSAVSPSAFSRRAFGRFAGFLAAGAALPLFTEPILAQLSDVGPIPPDGVKINANENPLGPCPEAAEAIHGMVARGGRYLFPETNRFVQLLASQEGLKPDYIVAYAGSSAPLSQAVLAFTSPARSFVVADPGYEAGGRAADFSGAKCFKVPLTSTYAHDVKGMASADPNAGLLYVCNPNNPTGTLTPRADIEWLLANKPKGSIVLLDEAYIHFSDAQRSTDFVAADKDLVILRTFSKLYGMAGIRAGVAIGRPDLIEKIQGYGYSPLPITSMAGATASLQVANLVAERKKNMRAVRESVFSFLQKNNIDFIPSDSNCFMLNAKRPAAEYIKAMRDQNVFVGRAWPVMPTYSRITVGTADEMAKFQTATLKALS